LPFSCSSSSPFTDIKASAVTPNIHTADDTMAGMIPEPYVT
jgi:hypothetical protein